MRSTRVEIYSSLITNRISSNKPARGNIVVTVRQELQSSLGVSVVPELCLVAVRIQVANENTSSRTEQVIRDHAATTLSPLRNMTLSVVTIKSLRGQLQVENFVFIVWDTKFLARWARRCLAGY